MTMQGGWKRTLGVTVIAALAGACSPSKVTGPDAGGHGATTGPGGTGVAGAAGGGAGPVGGAAGTTAAGGFPGATGGTAGKGGGSGTGGLGGGSSAGTGGQAGGGIVGTGGGSSGCSAASMWEPNNTFVQACPIQFKDMIMSSVGTDDSDDYYTFPAEAGVIYALNFWNTTPVSISMYVGIQFLAAGQMTPVMADTGVGPNSIFSVDIPAAAQAGTIILHFRMYNGACSYRFSVVSSQDPGIDPTTFELNNTPSTAAPLTLGTTIETQLTPPTDMVDYFSLPITKDHFYALTLALQPAGGSQYLSGSLVPTVGQTVSFLAQTGYGPGTTNFREFLAVDTGTALFRFDQYNGATLYDFTVYPSTADGLVHDPVTYEPNNTPHTAAPIQLGVGISSTINTTDDSLDYFEVPVDSGGQYVLTFANTTAAGGASVYVSGGIFMGLSTTQLAAISQTGIAPNTLNKTFVFTASAAGTFVALVQGYNGIATYTLAVTKQ